MNGIITIIYSAKNPYLAGNLMKYNMRHTNQNKHLQISESESKQVKKINDSISTISQNHRQTNDILNVHLV